MAGRRQCSYERHAASGSSGLCAIAIASACASPIPSPEPMPTSGFMAWRASPISATPGRHHSSQRTSVTSRYARSSSVRGASTSAPWGSSRSVGLAEGVDPGREGLLRAAWHAVDLPAAGAAAGPVEQRHLPAVRQERDRERLGRVDGAAERHERRVGHPEVGGDARQLAHPRAGAVGADHQVGGVVALSVGRPQARADNAVILREQVDQLVLPQDLEPLAQDLDAPPVAPPRSTRAGRCGGAGCRCLHGGSGRARRSRRARRTPGTAA